MIVVPQAAADDRMQGQLARGWHVAACHKRQYSNARIAERPGIMEAEVAAAVERLKERE